MSDMTGAPEGAAEGSSASESAPAPEFANARDAVAAAFDKLSQPQDGQSAAPEAQPQSPALTPDARARDQQGRFTAGQTQPETGQQPAPEPKPAEGQPQPDQGKPQAQGRTAPPGWSPQSKDAFASLPAFVQADIAKREQEVNQGLAELREYRDLRPYRDMAQRSGTNLGNVLGELSKFEDVIAKDPIEAIGSLSQLYGFDLRQAVSGLAQKLGLSLGAHGQGEGQPQPTAQPMALPPEVLARLERVDQIERHIQGQASAQVGSAIEAFAADPANEFFENVGQQMQQIIAADLNRYRTMAPHLAVKDAYEQAVWMNPDTRAVLIKRQTEADGRATAQRIQAAADQARQASKGLSGSPVSGVTPGSKLPDAKSTRDAVAAAYDMHANL